MDRKIVVIFISYFIIISFIIIAGSLFVLNYDDGTVNICYMPSDHESALLVANAQDQYAKSNIKTELVQFQKGGDIMIAMASGHVDVAYAGIAPTLAAIEKGVPIKIISGVQTEGSGIVVSKNSGINSASDLAGKKIATPGDSSIQYLLLKYYLKENGMTLDDVDVVAMEVPAMNDALNTDKIDGMLTFEPYVTIASENGAKILVESDKILPNHPCCVIVASDNFIKHHPDDVEKIVEVHKNATSYIKENTSDVPGLLPEDIVKDKEVEKKALSKYPFISGLNNDYEDQVMKFMNLEVELGLLKQPLSKDQIFWKADKQY